jgi:hypothetical protein
MLDKGRCQTKETHVFEGKNPRCCELRSRVFNTKTKTAAGGRLCQELVPLSREIELETMGPETATSHLREKEGLLMFMMMNEYHNGARTFRIPDNGAGVRLGRGEVRQSSRRDHLSVYRVSK